MSLIKETPAAGSIDVIGRLSDHNREERKERVGAAHGIKRYLRLIGPPFVVFVVLPLRVMERIMS